MLKELRPAQSLLPILALFLILIAAGLYGMQRASSGGAGPTELENLGFISATAYLFLLAGVGGLRIALRQRSKRPAHAYSWGLILILAFGVPLLISWLPGLVVIIATWTTQQSFLASDLLTWQPWLPALQAFALVILLFAGGELRIPKQIPPVSAALLAGAAAWGLGLWLVLVFSYRLTGLLAPLQETTGAHGVPLLAWLISLAGLLLLPVGEEILFRGRLRQDWQTRYGPAAGSLLSAAVFALACMRPLLWLPAFLVGLGLNWLAAKSPGLKTPILAHAALNLLIFIFIPALLI